MFPNGKGNINYSKVLVHTMLQVSMGTVAGLFMCNKNMLN